MADAAGVVTEQLMVSRQLHYVTGLGMVLPGWPDWCNLGVLLKKNTFRPRRQNFRRRPPARSCTTARHYPRSPSAILPDRSLSLFLER